VQKTWFKNNVEYLVDLNTYSKVLDKLNSLKTAEDFEGTAHKLIEQSRDKVADMLGAKPKEIVFVNSSNEANSIVIQSVPKSMEGKGNTYFVGSMDSLSALKSARKVKRLGLRMQEIPVDSEGYYDTKAFEETISIDATFVSFSAVQSEIGARHNVQELCRISKKVSAIVHTDLSTGLLEVPNLQKYSADVVTIGGKEIGSIKGSGIIFMREGVLIDPFISGSSKNNKLQVEENLFAALMMTERLSEIASKKNEDKKHFARLKTHLLNCLKDNGIDFRLLSPVDSHPGIIGLLVQPLSAESLYERLKVKGIEVFTMVRTLEDERKLVSFALAALGLTEEEMTSAFTVGFHHNHTEEDIDQLCKDLVETMKDM
jgi:cysteine desulfurase